MRTCTTALRAVGGLRGAQLTRRAELAERLLTSMKDTTSLADRIGPSLSVPPNPRDTGIVRPGSFQRELASRRSRRAHLPTGRAARGSP